MAQDSAAPSYQPTYSTIITAGDFGPWTSKLVLELPSEVDASDVSPSTFNVFCARCDTSTGEVLKCFDPATGRMASSQGYVPVRAAYPSSETGVPAIRSSLVTLELPEIDLVNPIRGDDAGGHSLLLDLRFRITQLQEIPGAEEPLSGLVFETCTGRSCPEAAGWQAGRMGEPVDGIQLEYAYYTPSFEPGTDAFGRPLPPKPEKAALIVWLHGAGEGGEGLERVLLGNRVTALSSEAIQKYFGGAAWVLAPQAPTYWMDDGVEQMGPSGKSIYSRPLKALIDEFVAAHADRIDTSRIVVGGLSNGGFMTVRLCADYPGFFAAAIPTCAPFLVDNQTPEVVNALAQTPMWFVQSKGDELVEPTVNSLPLYHRLEDAGAEVHMTLFDHIEDLTGVHRDPDGRPMRPLNHFAWIHVYNDFCRTELDGTNVMIDGEPVGLWEWAGRQRLG